MRSQPYDGLMIDDRLHRQLVREYLDEVDDVLADFDVTLGNLSAGSADTTAEGKRLFAAFSVLRTQGRVLEITFMDVALHRLCDYLEDLTQSTPKVLEDLQHYSTIVRGLVERSDRDEDVSALTRSLTVRTPPDLDNMVQIDVEIIMVEPNKTVSNLLSHELRACGYRVTTIRESVDCLSYAVQTKPDMIIAAAELDQLSGIDLACAFGAMPVTKAIPFAILTSRDRDHAALADLPQSAALLKKGAKFGDDLADALAQFGIT